MKLMDRIIDQCRPIADLPDDAIIWKATGRYILTNLVPVMNSMPKGAHLYFDLKDRPHRMFDMRFFACTIAGYRRFLRGRYVDLREDFDDVSGQEGWFVPESKLRRLIEPSLGESGIVPRLRIEPRVDGIRGHDNRSYINGTNLLNYWVARAARRVAPHVWI